MSCSRLSWLALLVVVCWCAGGCREPEGQVLIGAWEGTPRGAEQGELPQELELRTARFVFDGAGNVQITLGMLDGSQRTAQARWQVEEVNIDELVVRVTAPAQGEQPAHSTMLQLDFETPDRLVLSEIEGDYRVPPLVLTRQNDAAG